jgi:proliferating cell nuclear antigen
MDSSHVALV